MQYLADSSHAAKAGDYRQIYASGLGAVDPPVEAGTATPDNPLRQVAGLTPGSAGLYQVNAGRRSERRGAGGVVGIGNRGAAG